MSLAVGIDVHKAECVVVIGAERAFAVPRTRPRLAGLAQRLAARRPDIIVLEPSGGYERPVLEVLQAHAPPVKPA